MGKVFIMILKCNNSSLESKQLPVPMETRNAIELLDKRFRKSFDTHEDTVLSLIESCSKNDIPVVKTEFKVGLLYEANKVSLLHMAGLYEYVKVADLLVRCYSFKHKCLDSLGQIPLHYAAWNGHLQYFRNFADQETSSTRDSGGRTPLHYSCHSSNLELVQYLIAEQGCHPECQHNDGSRPLHYASYYGQLHIVKYLITEHHCSPTKKNAQGWNPLHYACMEGQLSVVRYFVDGQYCAPECKDNYGCTPLHYASQRGHLETLRYLVEVGQCDPDVSNNDGQSPLHQASGNGHLQIVQYLLNTGRVNPIAIDQYDYTPLNYAEKNRHGKTIDAIMKYFSGAYSSATSPTSSGDYSILSTPTLLQLIKMKGPNGSDLKVIKNIAAGDYELFGMLLLHDDNGVTVGLFRKNHIYEGAESITKAIIKEWLTRGSPTAPCTYKHLIECLRQSDLGELADSIEAQLWYGLYS